jgi:hypothetical protein
LSGEEMDNNIHKSDKRQAIIDFVKSHPECDKEEVIEYCTAKGIASRLTVRKVICELQSDSILNIDREKGNSKSYKLTINSGNLLVIVPQDIKDIHSRFKNFVAVVKSLYLKGPNFEYREKFPFSQDKFNYKEFWDSVPALPYHVIDIVNDVYTFYFVFILPKKIESHSHVTKLYSVFFGGLMNMYSCVSKEMHDVIPAYDLSSLKNSILYRSYSKLKNDYSSFSKVFHLVRICRVLDIEDSLYGVLDLLWDKNTESADFVYDLKFESIPPFFTRVGENYNGFTHSNAVIRKIHNNVDWQIFLYEGTDNEDRLSFRD